MSSNLDNIGNDLVEMASRKYRVQLDATKANYIKVRLSDRAYKTLKDQADNWIKNGGEPPVIQMELQDLYLSDPTLPSQVGKLVKEDWRKYPALGINLGLIRAGTYSANTRAISLLHFTPEVEIQAFQEYLPVSNPFHLDFKQGYLLLYSLLQGDGEVAAPLFVQLAKSGQSVFNDRFVGDYLPEIYQAVSVHHRNRAIGVEMRERLQILEQSAASIVVQRGKDSYEGGSAREEAARPRIEPYVDIGLFNKPNPMKYEYQFAQAGLRWAEALHGVKDSQAIEEFLHKKFFATSAAAQAIIARTLTSSDEIVPRLRSAWKAISSSNGYVPIEEMALVAGIKALVDEQLIIEIATARDALIAFQKANPYQVRFSVDRLGALAHAKFIDESTR
jgi:hypothetical protein